MIKKYIFRILLGILVFVALVVGSMFLLLETQIIYHFSALNWIPILICSIGMYVSGIINKNTPVKLLPFLGVSLIVFQPFRFLYFPFVLILLFFVIGSLVLSRKEIQKKYKAISTIIMIVTFGYYLFSQPLIIQQKGFVETPEGDLINALVLWDFSKPSDNRLPDLSFVDKDKNLVSLSNYEGKTLYVSFWATWCAPCIIQKPLLKQMQDKFKDMDTIMFIDISIDEDENSWLSYLENKNPSRMQLHTNGNEITIREKLGFTGIPFHIIISPDGFYKQSNDLEYSTTLLLDPDKLRLFIEQ
ncbi:Thiol-disulfide isomerase or thioredoxin [Aquimarina amphilecti]|uniref:Thiol-disulfide isomerase or thioredoxin n=1 Tax=Aquimarina amphilecti TaxID=1038014 RepID=A0A1H7VX23_AQUAM|nr:TlpA disulfide reductase family protein [Aquimarina amphilecti]SEM13347.1 Thiol-disulfide isomerase or thioredoxin [Aquimarina amphilecti]